MALGLIPIAIVIIYTNLFIGKYYTVCLFNLIRIYEWNHSKIFCNRSLFSIMFIDRLLISSYIIIQSPYPLDSCAMCMLATLLLTSFNRTMTI